MDFTEFRTSAMERWLDGRPSELATIVLEGRLTNTEREFVADIVSGKIGPRPKPRGRPARSGHAVSAGLIRFWLRDVDGVEKEDAILREIETALSVSKTMARKLLSQIDRPKTRWHVMLKILLQTKLHLRKALWESDDDESRDFARKMRCEDLKPNSQD